MCNFFFNVLEGSCLQLSSCMQRELCHIRLLHTKKYVHVHTKEPQVQEVVVQVTTLMVVLQYSAARSCV
jgi:hypothetical protein